MFTGRELENELNIPQQYRSRTDKQFSNFISPSSQNPRLYSDKDYLVYRTVFALKAQNQTRPVILAALAKLANAGQVDFYPSEIYPDTETILCNADAPKPDNLNALSDKPNMKPAPRKQSNNTPELYEKIGAMSERLRIAEETIGDLETVIKKQSEQIAYLMARVANKPEELNNNDLADKINQLHEDFHYLIGKLSDLDK